MPDGHSITPECVAFVQEKSREFFTAPKDKKPELSRAILLECGARFGASAEHLLMFGIQMNAAMQETHVTNIDKSIKADRGASVVGAVTGDNAMVEMRDITVYNNHVDRSKSLAPEIKEALKVAREGIEASKATPDHKALLTDALTRLTAQLEKPTKEQDKGVISMLWDSLKGAASIAGGIAAVGKILEMAGYIS